MSNVHFSLNSAPSTLKYLIQLIKSVRFEMGSSVFTVENIIQITGYGYENDDTQTGKYSFVWHLEQKSTFLRQNCLVDVRGSLLFVNHVTENIRSQTSRQQRSF